MIEAGVTGLENMMTITTETAHTNTEGHSVTQNLDHPRPDALEGLHHPIETGGRILQSTEQGRDHAHDHHFEMATKTGFAKCKVGTPRGINVPGLAALCVSWIRLRVTMTRQRD